MRNGSDRNLIPWVPNVDQTRPPGVGSADRKWFNQNYVRESAPSPEMSSKMESGSDQHSILELSPERQVRKIGLIMPPSAMALIGFPEIS
ncbi:hypothetical protein ACLKA7_005610 [Drosophila subpalustris]